MKNETAVKLIDQLIEEHKLIAEKTGGLEQAANDAVFLGELKEARESFVPGRLDQQESLQKLEGIVASIRPWLFKHFEREETVLLGMVEDLGEPRLLNSLNSLLLEHADLRSRMVQIGEHIDELKSGNLARYRWDASANDMRAHLTHTRNLLSAHNAMENDLFGELRRYFAA